MEVLVEVFLQITGSGIVFLVHCRESCLCLQSRKELFNVYCTFSSGVDEHAELGM